MSVGRKHLDAPAEATPAKASIDVTKETANAATTTVSILESAEVLTAAEANVVERLEVKPEPTEVQVSASKHDPDVIVVEGATSTGVL